ncbi:XRE family transcriptional regulator [Abyssalbus ytuae]|uniref:LexA family transcriptional regulator n=1 Tax=Abyssalbus ytuae TaxID=2926907 RepID=A0A9E6ZMP9_9FLAO|nr:LexA family transcriptional regulator [Abyssalbus ytuae]UOB18677.1 LexA family transcriptional regulator [Abyssalbus ytuae]
MKSDLTLDIVRFKELREENNLTQQEFARILNIKNSTADIERGKTRISGIIIAELLEKFDINPLWLYGKSERKFLKLKIDTSPKVVVVNNNEENERIVLVNVKAAAGYPHNIQDVNWYEELPSFDIPLPEYKNASFRGFQVEGDSMVPGLYPKEWVLAKAVEHPDMLDNNSICVVILQDSVLVKKIKKYPEEKEKITLISINEEYPPINIDTHEIMELWQVKSKLTFEIDKNPQQNQTLSQLHQLVLDLKKDIEKLKK